MSQTIPATNDMQSKHTNNSFMIFLPIFFLNKVRLRKYAVQ